jgi:hypothetical protein
MTTMNLITPKVGAKHELLFNEPATGVKLVLLFSSGLCCLILLSDFIFYNLCHRTFAEYFNERLEVFFESIFSGRIWGPGSRRS